jgi:chemotaxis protein methyltransferase CheR
MQQLGLSGGYPEYKEYLELHLGEWKQLDRLCDVTISKFFRDRNVWDFLRDQVLFKLLQKREAAPVTIWSAGCCNGEEPYSLAMINEQLAAKSGQQQNISILATDRNAEVLERAQTGRYPSGALKELTENEITTFFHETGGTDDEDFEINAFLKQRISFEQRDIQHSLPDKVFDLILCRNLVFTYFTRERQLEFLQRLKPRLANDGFLIVGSQEQLPEVGWLEAVNETHRIYSVDSTS